MKKYNYISAFVLFSSAVAFTACSGSSDGTEGEGTGVLRLEVSKDVLEADGKDEAVFTVYDASGVDVTSKAYVMDLGTGLDVEKNQSGRPSFTAIANGEYEFQADYKGEKAQVTVKAQNRRNYEEYFRRIAVFKVTGTWCKFCPSMTAALEKIDQKYPNRLVKMAFHYNASDMPSDPYALDATSWLYKTYNLIGAPTAIYNLNTVTQDRTNISAIINKELRDNPATCGIKAKAVSEGDDIKVTASLKSSTGGEYDLAYVVLQDNLPGGPGMYEKVYDYTASVCTNNIISFSTNAKKVEKDAETVFGYTFSGVKKNLTSKNISVAVYALTKKNDKYMVDNIVECELDGDEVDYKLND